MTRGILAVLVGLLCLAFGPAASVPPARAEAGTTPALVAIPPGHDADLRFFPADRAPLEGVAAFAAMPQADVTLWLAGNQFFAMNRVVGDFQARHPGLSVGLVTLPPGLILKAIQAGGWTYQGHSLAMRPDIYGTVSTDQLRATGQVHDYITYMHNALELMVARGNPKHITGLADLLRPDVRVTLPNPLTEGIMSFYGKPVLKRLGMWSALSPGEDCADCDPSPRVHFAMVHHREIPARIALGQTDVGLVWRTETIAAIARGAAVEGVALPPEDNAALLVNYVAAMLDGSGHKEAAAAMIGFMASQAGQDAYAAFGFVPASPEERTLRPLPPG